MKTIRELERFAKKELKLDLDKMDLSSERAVSTPKVDLDTGLTDLLQNISVESPRVDYNVTFRDVGTVQQVGNGVACLSGLPHIGTGELVRFPSGVEGMVLNLDHDSIDVILLGSDEGILGGDLVTSTGKYLKVPVGPDLLGRVVNPLGQPLDSDAPIAPADFYPLEHDAPGIIRRSKVNTPLQTGIKIIDSLIPIGRGQRELILGDRKTGKTSLAVDTILNQKIHNIACIYVSIGQKKSTTLEVIETLRQNGAMTYTTVVVASPDDPPALRYIAPFTGCSMAEYLVFRMNRDVLVVYDDLSKHANSYRELSLLLRRPPGREAYPGDIFYLHSRLLERACKMDEAYGGGSMTALPIVEIQRGNVSSYIPTNLISITDGQIILDTGQFNEGNRPAIDIGRSVSRVGGAAQTAAMRTVSGSLRLELSQYEEVVQFTRFKAETDVTTKKQIESGQRVIQALRQGVHAPESLAEQVIWLYTVLHEKLNSFPLEQFSKVERDLLAWFDKEHQVLVHLIQQTKAVTPEVDKKLSSLLAEYFSTPEEKEEDPNEKDDSGGNPANPG